jgi:hypothetical protein
MDAAEVTAAMVPMQKSDVALMGLGVMGEGFLAGGKDAKDLVEPGGGEDATDLLPQAEEDKVSTTTVDALHGFHDQRDAGTVDGRDFAEVEQNRLFADLGWDPADCAGGLGGSWFPRKPGCRKGASGRCLSACLHG